MVARKVIGFWPESCGRRQKTVVVGCRQRMVVAAGSSELFEPCIGLGSGAL
jgi:hypothetical protein